MTERDSGPQKPKKPIRILENDGKASPERENTIKLNQVSVRKKRDDIPRQGLFNFTLEVIYKSLYFLGVAIMRRLLRTKRKTRLFFSRLGGGLRAGFLSIGQGLQRGFKGALRRLFNPFRRIGMTYKDEKPRIAEKRKQHQFPLTSYWAVTRQVLRLIWRIIATILNYAAPIVVAVILVTTISDYTSRIMGLQVTYKGEVLGVIESEKDFSTAVQEVSGRIIPAADGSGAYVADIPTFELVEIASKEDYDTAEELADRIISLSGSEIESAVGVYIGGELLGAVDDAAGFDTVYDEVENIRLTNATGKPEERIEFQKTVAFKKGLYPSDSMVSASSLIDMLHSDETQEETYTVEEEDTPSGIADKLGVPYSQLLEMNPNIEEELQPGMTLYTQRAVPFLSVKIIYTDVYSQEVPYEVEEIENVLYATSYRNVESEGVSGVSEVTAEITTVNGVEVERSITNSRVLVPPINERVTVGPLPNTPPASTSQGSAGTAQESTASTTIFVDNPNVNAGSYAQTGFKWPMDGGYISCYVGGYPGHAGIDIAGTGGIGSRVYASASGTVTKAVNQWTGYGFHIIIDHGDGYTTLYGHNSQLLVQVGDYVAQGQLIALSGNTGMSTGPHLHFEMRKNGVVINPVNYVGNRSR
ncbi:MAG: peptidoglycan DD-metalloendopeptidase family protein [Oscillospiraceae bacterium]